MFLLIIPICLLLIVFLTLGIFLQLCKIASGLIGMIGAISDIIVSWIVDLMGWIDDRAEKRKAR